MPPTYRLRKWRRAAFQEQRSLCIWCGLRMFLPHEPEWKSFPKRRVTAEHVIPRGKRGRDARSNIAAACANCNEKRKDYSLEEWLGILPERLKLAGNPQHFTVVLGWLSRYAANISPPQRATVETGLTANEEKSRNGSGQAIPVS